MKKDNMTKKRVAILGVTGMLGSIMLDSFVQSREFDVIATCRKQKEAKLFKHQYPKVAFRRFNAEKTSLKGLSDAIYGAQWVVNAIGVTKPNIHDDEADKIDRAIIVNAHFPHLLTKAAESSKAKIIQIATDCVFSGQKGQYLETDPHDCLDVYGKTKSLGEVFGDNIYHLRCSVIGPELKGHNSLLDWFLSQPKGAEVNGFTNHLWNGVTALHFARICQGIIKKGVNLPHVQHVIPGNAINKADMLKIIAKEYNRKDIVVRDMEAPLAIDRTLSTVNKKLNRELWRLGGYAAPPTIAKMIKELAQYRFLGKDIKL